MHHFLPLAIGTSMLLLLAAAPAHAASFQCEASALRVTVATAPAVEPITANRGAAQCAPQEAGGACLSGAAAVSRCRCMSCSLIGVSLRRVLRLAYKPVDRRDHRCAHR